MISNFLTQALSKKPLTIYGDGSQTRSVQYIEDDLIEVTIRLMRNQESRPVNIGNPIEFAVGEIAQMVIEISGHEEGVVVHEAPSEDDPKRRCPDITRAREVLGWQPRVSAREGLKRTLEWFSGRSNKPEASSAKR